MLYNMNMCKLYTPFAHAKSVYEIDVEFFQKIGAQTLLVDLDNTLDSYRTKQPSQRAFDLKDKIESQGLEMIIVSNNRGKRVSHYAEKLGARFISSAGKPFARKLKKRMKELGIDPGRTVMIGDQAVTDVAAGNRCKIRTILTDKIVKEDQPTTHFNRLFDRPIRRYLKRHHKLVDWRNR